VQGIRGAIVRDSLKIGRHSSILMAFYLNRQHGMTHRNTSEVGYARTAQIHASPQNGVSSKPEAMSYSQPPLKEQVVWLA